MKKGIQDLYVEGFEEGIKFSLKKIKEVKENYAKVYSANYCVLLFTSLDELSLQLSKFNEEKK